MYSFEAERTGLVTLERCCPPVIRPALASLISMSRTGLRDPIDFLRRDGLLGDRCLMKLSTCGMGGRDAREDLPTEWPLLSVTLAVSSGRSLF